MAFESPILRSRTSGWKLWKPEEQTGADYPVRTRDLIALPPVRRRSILECENPDCQFQSALHRILRRRSSEGVMLQGHWYCSLDCFEHAIASVFAGLLKLQDTPRQKSHRVPIGLLLLGRGVINQDQLKEALKAQQQARNERLGRCLVRLGVASATDISTALAAQWGCAVFPLERDNRYRDCSQMIPLPLLEAAHMLPLHYVAASQLLFVGFSQDIDHTTLYSVERLLGSRTEACVVSEVAMEQALEDIRGVSRPAEIVFETRFAAHEMARTVRDYAVKIGAEELLLARPREFLWVRLRAGGRSWDLMFRLP
jgi:hypothetical protein